MTSPWRADFAAAAAALPRALGFAGLGRFDVAEQAGTALAFRIAPERILVRLANRARWEETASSFDLARLCVLDMSHSRSVVAISGGAAADLLARLLAIDLDASVFGAGRFAQTGLSGIPVLLHRSAGEGAAADFELYVPSSFAAAVWDLLSEHARPFGYVVSEPA